MNSHPFLKKFLQETSTFFTKVAIVFVFVVFLGAVLFATSIRPFVNQVSQSQRFSVTGEAKKFVKPDTALVNVGAVFTDTDATAAQKKAQDAINNATTELKANGISDDQIRTVTYNLNPNYDYPNNSTRIKDYTMDITLEIRTTDFDKINKVLQIAVNNKLNKINSISFSLENQDAVKSDLRKLAIDNARSKADDLTSTSGLKLGKLVDVQENAQYPILFNSYNNLSSTGGKSVPAFDASQAAVSAGQTEISLNVTLVYEVQ